MADFRHYCASCSLRPQCEYTFGAFYANKSANGTGCNHKIHPFDLERVKQCAATVRPADVLTENVAATRNTNAMNKYIVSTDDGREFTTYATSEDQAINNVRFRHFRNKPKNRCPGFTANMVQIDGKVQKKPPTKIEILKRIRMMKGY